MEIPKWKKRRNDIYLLSDDVNGEWSRKRKREKVSLWEIRAEDLVWPVEVSRMKQNGGNFRVHVAAHGAEKGPWPSATHAVVQRRNDNTHPPLGLIKGIAWHEMQLFLHATTHTSYPSIRFTAMAEYTAHVSVRTRPVRCLMERRVCHPVMARHFALGTLNSRG